MPNCRNCGARLSKFDKDICPICGYKKPLDGVESHTVEVTSEIQSVMGEISNYHTRSRVVACVFSMLFGWTGAAFYYLYYFFAGGIFCLINLGLGGGLFAILFCAVKLDLLLSIIIPIISIYVLNFIIGIIFLYYHDLKDGRGDFIK